MTDERQGKTNRFATTGGNIAVTNDTVNAHEDEQSIISSLLIEFSWVRARARFENYIGGLTVGFSGTTASREKFYRMFRSGELRVDSVDFCEDTITFPVPGGGFPVNGLPSATPSQTVVGMFHVSKGDLLVKNDQWSIVIRSSEVTQQWYHAGSVVAGSGQLLDELHRLQGTRLVAKFCIVGQVPREEAD